MQLEGSTFSCWGLGDAATLHSMSLGAFRFCLCLASCMALLIVSSAIVESHKEEGWVDGCWRGWQ